MPSPFPGVDPYLEDPLLWPGFHQRLITHIEEALNASLPKHYAANMQERVYVDLSHRSIYPDIVVTEHTPPQVKEVATQPYAALELPWAVAWQDEPLREVFVEIVALNEPARVVTVVEVLSFANKEPHSDSRSQYRKKQAELLHSPANLVEIDLLRSGEHTVAPPWAVLRRRGTWDGLISVHRAYTGAQCEVWPVYLRQPLPSLHIPLAAPDPDVVLDFQTLYNQCYAAGPYARRVDYARPPTVPLTPADAAWAAQVVQAALKTSA